MANSVIGDNRELLEYCHLMANPNVKAVWAHSYGNELGQLAQGMPGKNTDTNTIVFIHPNQVPRNRTKDVTYSLITCLMQPEKIDEPNRMRLVCVCVLRQLGSRGWCVVKLAIPIANSCPPKESSPDFVTW